MAIGEYFTVFTVDEGKKELVDQETVASPVGCGCKSNIAQTLAEMGVTLMLAGKSLIDPLIAGGSILLSMRGDLPHVFEEKDAA